MMVQKFISNDTTMIKMMTDKDNDISLAPFFLEYKDWSLCGINSIVP
jgi:hypothetical protein